MNKLMYKIAKAYYEDGLTQQEIARRFGLSRIKVSRLLNRARREKIVQITIQPVQVSNADLERRLEGAFDLQEAVIATCTEDTDEAVVNDLGPAAAQTLIRCLQGQETVGISWGRSLLSAVNALPKVNLPDVRIVQLVGGLGELDAQTHGAELARRVADTFGARLRLLHAPGLVKNKSVRDALVMDPQVCDTLELARRADIALVGIGVLTPGSTLTQAGILNEEETADLRERGMVGDIAMRFFDGEGVLIKAKADKRIISTELDDLRRIRRVIAVAGGKHKREAIRAVLRGRLVDVLVTDQFTARDLLERIRT
jgi:DNA-binding transcriptional regulator LsrR (DeoR family)